MGKEQMRESARHEVKHGVVAMRFGVLKRIDVRPQGHGVLAVTEITSTSLDQHMAIAMASVVAGHDGTGGDRGIADLIEHVTEGRVTAHGGKVDAENILSQFKPAELDRAADIIVERGGVILGTQLSGIIYEAKRDVAENRHGQLYIQPFTGITSRTGEQTVIVVSLEEQKRKAEEEKRKKLLEQFFEESRKAA